MKKEELIRYRAGLATLLVSGSMFLGGCASSKGFVFERGEDNSYVVLEGSFINNNCIDKCYVVEAYNKITGETELFIAKKDYDQFSSRIRTNGLTEFVPIYYYTDLMNNDNKLFYQDNNRNNFFKYIKEAPLYDYMVTLDLIKARYSYEDMQKILEEIKAVYEFEDVKELVK